jgi:hypothetical protein
MVTREEFAELALTLPETTPGSHFGQPDFRVRGKIFCGLERTAQRASLKVRKDVQALLIASRPRAFVPAAGFWGESGWTYVELPRVGRDELRELLLDAWRLIAPAHLVISVSPTARSPKRQRSTKKSALEQTERRSQQRTETPSKKRARRAKKKRTPRR